VPPAADQPADSSDFLALGLKFLDQLPVPTSGQHAAQIDHLLNVDVLVLGMMGENLPLIADTYLVFPVVALFDGCDRFQQRKSGSPLNVVTGGMLKDLEQRVPLTGVELSGVWGRRNGARLVPSCAR
jgi:hypothetical protein